MIKRLFTALVALFLSLCLNAQEVNYFLPRTTITVEVDAVRETFFAGPYAAYAHSLLGIEVRQADGVETHINSVRLVQTEEADLSAAFTAPSGATESMLALTCQGLVAFRSKADAELLNWRFSRAREADFSTSGLAPSEESRVITVYQTVRTDSTFSRIPIHQEVSASRSVAERAREAATIILNARRDRYNIASGNTDATFSGEALQAALDELDRLEQEYLVLFRGYSVTEPIHGSYDITPSAQSRSQRYQVFTQDGETYYLDFETVSVPEAPEAPAGRVSSRTRYIHYREPAVCVLSFCTGNETLLQARATVYQLGRECTLPIGK